MLNGLFAEENYLEAVQRLMVLFGLSVIQEPGSFKIPKSFLGGQALQNTMRSRNSGIQVGIMKRCHRISKRPKHMNLGMPTIYSIRVCHVQIKEPMDLSKQAFYRVTLSVLTLIKY